MVAWLGVASLAAAYLLFGRGIAGVTVATATTLSLAEPATATVLGVTLLDEQMTGEAAAGMTLVLTALVILLVKRRARTTTWRSSRRRRWGCGRWRRGCGRGRGRRARRRPLASSLRRLWGGSWSCSRR